MLAHGRFAKLVLACVRREFPSQPYGCYDWHSAVHGHWLLAHLAKEFPRLATARKMRGVLDEHLSAKNLKVEARYLERHPGFERPYGWAWLLKLALELHEWEDAEARRWLAHLEPLLEAIEANYLAWLPKQTYPIRSGTHTNTAFGLSFALDYAIAAGRSSLQKAIRQKALRYYALDCDYPASWEPGGNDFFSPCLVEADLMRRVVPDFPRWFARFAKTVPGTLLAPATVSDRSDGQLAHLDGLNLSRAWCFFNLSTSLPKERKVFLNAAKRHLHAGLAHVASGSYAGEHWLASFAAYALSAERASAAAAGARAA
jgi:hypothetical protein